MNQSLFDRDYILWGFMSSQKNKEIIINFYKSFDNRQMDEAMELLSHDFVAHLSGVTQPLNAEEFKQFGMEFYLAFSQGKHIFDEIITAEDKVITYGTFIATHSGNFQGLPATGKQIRLSIMHIDRTENGKIVEHWGQGDAMGLMQQLGILFIPSPKLLLLILRGFIFKLFAKSI
ncbi:MAG: ester cyclase [Pseudanabaena sp.]|jgi:steroid delta-isomerase-like uncharacterized protein